MKRRLVEAYGSIRIGDPLEPGTLMGPLIDQARGGQHDGGARAGEGRGGRVLYGGKRIDRPGFYVEPTIVEVPRQLAITCEETFAPILYVLRVRRPRRGDPRPQRRAAGALLGHLHPQHALAPSASWRRAAATAASPTSTSAPRAPRSAAPSAARRRPAAAARPAPTPGRPTCAARPARSTGGPSCRWRRGWSSRWGRRRGKGHGDSDEHGRTGTEERAPCRPCCPCVRPCSPFFRLPHHPQPARHHLHRHRLPRLHHP